jgi:hypothetical protein
LARIARAYFQFRYIAIHRSDYGPPATVVSSPNPRKQGDQRCLPGVDSGWSQDTGDAMIGRSRIEKFSKTPLPSVLCFPAILLMFGLLGWVLEFVATKIFIH